MSYLLFVFSSQKLVQLSTLTKLDLLSEDKHYDAVKINPVFYWADADMEAYLEQHNLLNEWDYFDPTKTDEKRECGIHVIGEIRHPF